ncbi:MAG TPA: beta galactosidase jelly roll domain-containing protein [Bacteroidales bacterium]|nr:beta galactosidase jelly roll domain-containing protein [Bacteroidales bacterium]
MKSLRSINLLYISVIAVVLVSCSGKQSSLHERISLADNWKVQKSGALNETTGSALSATGVNTDSWYAASVPSTIMGVLTANGLYKDIFKADSIKNVDTAQFRQSWWYRTEFALPAVNEKQHIRLFFDGISFYANIWLNGKQIASKDSTYGIFRTFSFDITKVVNKETNVLAVEVFRQNKGDLGHGFVDWNPAPPDRNMGLWRPVYIDITGDVAIKNTFIHSDVNTQTLNEASLTLTTEVTNSSGKKVSGDLKAKGDGIEFSIPVKLEPGESKKITVTPKEAESLHITNPRLWWCNGMGNPELYKLSLQFNSNNSVSDQKDITFGIRTIEAYTNAGGHKGFKLNGREVLIRGAGWTDDLFFRDTPESDEIQVQYVKDMNLNTIRFENVWGKTSNIYDLCDRYGLLVMVGWSCQWEWENYLGKPCDDFGGISSEKDMNLAVEYLNDQIRLLQNHPSVFVWMLGSDMLPRPALEKRYRDLISSIDDRPYLGAASWRKSEVSGNTGVKMKGPYNYVGPSYWYIDSVNGGAYGFNTETGPGPQIPVLESLEKMIPANKLWPINDMWNFHCNPSESFGDLSIFNGVLNRRYGQAYNLKNYLLKADAQGYEAMKAMFEAFRVNKPNTTGIVQWMLNSAWPSFYWQLYDYYLLPTSAYFAAKKANEPLQLVYNYGNNQVYVVNESLKSLARAKAGIKMTDLNGKEILTDEVAVNVDPDQSAFVYKLPDFKNIVFLSLTLSDESNNVIASNFYWLPGGPDIYDWQKTEWYYTPIKTSADLKPLNYLQPVALEISADLKENRTIEATVKNPSKNVAFLVSFTVKDTASHTVFPVFWNDNYISLLPGETKIIQCKLPEKISGDYTLDYSGWNVNEQHIKMKL